MVSCAVILVAQPIACAEANSDCGVFPSARWIIYDKNEPPEHRVILRTTIRRDGSIIWHGASTSEESLVSYLQVAREMNPTPYLVLQYEAGTPCSQLVHFREVFERRANCGRETVCSARVVP